MQLPIPAGFFDLASLKKDLSAIYYVNIEKTDVTKPRVEMSSYFFTDPNGFPANYRKSRKQVLAKLLQVLFESYVKKKKTS